MRSFKLLATARVFAVVGIALIFSTLLLSTLIPDPAKAAQTIPYKINFQGRLTDASGNTLANGLYNIKFRIMSAPTSGTNLFEEAYTQTAVDNRIQVTNGLFSVQLGSLTSLSTFDFTQHPIYLEIELPTPATATCATNGCAVFTEGPFTPRQPLASTPYAFNADKLDGVDGASFARNDAANTFSASNSIQATATGALLVQTAAGAATVFGVDTANTKIGIGAAPTTNGATLQVTGTLTSSGTITVGTDTSLSTTALTIGGTAVCTSSGCTSSSTLQNAYDATADATPEIVLTAAQGALSIQDATSALGTNLLEVASNGGGATYFGVSASTVSLNVDTTLASGKALTVIGGITANRPAGTTEGQIFYDQTLDQMLIYSNGKWQADRSTATKIVASSTSLNKEKADYVADGNTATAADGDQVEINQAIVAVNAAGGGTVFLLEGTYTIDATIAITSNINLVGSGTGTVITIPNTFNTSINFISESTNPTNIKISNMRLNGNGAQQSSGTIRGIFLADIGTGVTATGATIHDMAIDSFDNDGILLNSSFNSTVSRSTIRGNQFGIYNNGTGDNNIFSDNIVEGNTSNGIEIFSGINTTVTGNIVKNNGASGIYTDGTNGTFTGNTVQSNTSHGIRIQDDYQTVIGNTFASNGGDGISALNDHHVITGNNVISNTGNGVYLFGAYATVNGNTITGNTSDGIEVSGSYNNIASNKVHNNGAHGIILNSGPDNSQVVGNSVTDTAGTSYPIYIFNADSIGNYVSDNTFSCTACTTVGGYNITDTGTGTIFGGQVDSNNDYVLQGATRTVTQQDLESSANINTIHGGIGQFGNLLTYSEQFNQNQSPWATSNTTVTGENIAAPDGQTTADLLNWGASNATISQASSVAVGGTYTFSVWIRGGASDRNVSLRIDGSTGGTGTPKAVIAKANTWQRFYVTQNTGSCSVSCTGNVAVRIIGATSGDDVYAWGAQLIAGTNLGAYVRSNAATVTASTGVVANGGLFVSSANATNKPLVVQAATGQTANLFEIQDTAGATLTAIDSAGRIVLPNLGTADSTTALCRNTSNQIATCSGGATATLQSSYDATADATPEIVLTTAQGALTIQDATSALGTNLLEVQANGGGSTYFGVSASTISLNVDTTVASGKALTVIGGITGSRPAGTTEGQIFYDQTLDQMLVYSNGKWQADRTTATKIVAASDSQNKEKADYVADGTDDEVEINAAITALPATGGIVYLLDGTFTLDDSIDADDAGIEMNKSNLTLTGSGPSTIIKLKNSVTGATINAISDNSGSAINRVTISNLKLDGNKANNASGTQNGIVFTTVGSGNGSTATPGPRIENVIVEQFRSNGIEYSTSSNGSITNTTILANGTTTGSRGIDIGSSSVYNTFTGNTIQGNTGYGILMNTSSNSNTFTGNTFQGNGASGIHIGSSSNIISGNSSTGNTGDGITISIGANNTISGNTITGNSLAGNSAHGIDVSSSAGNLVSNNRIISAGGTSGSSTGSGINISSTDTSSFVGNYITDSYGTGYAINISSSSNSNYLSDNTYSGTGAASINDASTSTIYAGQVNSNNDLMLQGSTRTLTQQDLESSAMINTGYGGIGQFGNLLTYSEQFDHANWVKSNVTLPATNNTAPDNQPVAETLDAGAGSPRTIIQTSGTAVGSTYTFSVWLKSNTTSNRTVLLWVDGSTGGTETAKTVTVTPNWQRFYVTQNTSTYTGSVQAVINLSGSTDDVYAWGAQLIAGSSPGAYVRSTASTIATSSGVVSNGGVFVSSINATDKPLIVQAAISQSANLFEVQDTAGGILAAIDSAGRMILPALGSADTATTLCRNTSNQIATCTGGGGSTTLQSAYNTDADSADATIALTSTDGGLIIQNPSSSGAANGATLKISQLATGAVEGLTIESAGTAAAFKVANTAGTNLINANTNDMRVGIGAVGGFSDAPTKLADPASVPTSSGRSTAFSPDGIYMSVGSDTSPFITIYKRSGDTFTKLTDPATLPPNSVRSTAFSPDGTYMTAGHLDSPFITIYKRSGDTFTKLTDPSTLPLGTGTGTDFSSDGTYMSVSHASNPYITIYKRSGDTFTKLTDPATLPGSAGTGTAFSPNGTYMSVAHTSSPYISIYKRSGDTFTKLTNPSTLPTGSGTGTDFSPDGMYLSIAHDTSPYISIYKRSGDTFTKLADPATLPTGAGGDTTFSPDGTYMSVAHTSSPYISIYKRSGDTFTKLADPATLPTGLGTGAAFSPDGTHMSISSFGPPYIQIYKGIGGASNRLEIASGTTATEGLSFGKENILYRSAPGFLSLAAGGSLALEGGNLTVQGSIGIGTNSPSAALDIAGNTHGDALAISNSTSTGNIAVFKDNSTAVFTIADGGGVIARNATNSTAAFQVQNATGTSIMNIDTSTNSAGVSFETGTDSWLAKNSSVVTRTTSQGYSGTAALQIVADAANEGAHQQQLFSANEVINLSVYAKLNSGTMNDFEIGYTEDGGSDVPCLTGQTVVTGGWARFTCSFTTSITNNIGIADQIYVKQTGATSRTFFIDAIQANTGVFSMGNINFGGNIVSPTTFKNISNSTTAFQVLDASGNSLIVADTLNGKVGIGTATPDSSLHVIGGLCVETTDSGCAATSGSVTAATHTGTGAVTVSSGGSGALTLTSASGTAVLGGSTNTIQRTNSALSIDVVNTGASSTLNVVNSNGTQVANVDVEGGMNIGSGQTYKIGNSQISSAALSNDSNIAKLDGNNLFTGTLNQQNTSASALLIQSAAGATTILTADTSGNKLRVGSSTTDATAVLFVLDSYNNSTDPAGENGAMYYNTSRNKNRCYENGAWKDCIPASDTYVYKTADQNNTSVTLVDITDLVIPVSASTNYLYECRIFFSSGATANGFMVSSTAPASPTLFSNHYSAGLSSAGGTSWTTNWNTNDGGSPQTTSAIAGDGNIVNVNGMLKNGSNAGNIQLRFRNDVGTSTHIIRAGSYCRYSVIP